MEEEGEGLDKRSIIVDKIDRINILSKVMHLPSSTSTTGGLPSPPRPLLVAPPQPDAIVIDSNDDDDDDDDDVIVEGVSESDAWMKVQKDGKPSKRQRKRHRIRTNQQKQQQQQLVNPGSSAVDDAALPTLNIAKAGPSGSKKQALVSPTIRRENEASGFMPDQAQSNATPFAMRVPKQPLLPAPPPGVPGQLHMSAQQVGMSGQPLLSLQQAGVSGQSLMSAQQAGFSGQPHMSAQPPGVPTMSFVPRTERDQKRYVVIDGSNVAVA